MGSNNRCACTGLGTREPGIKAWFRHLPTGDLRHVMSPSTGFLPLPGHVDGIYLTESFHVSLNEILYVKASVVAQVLKNLPALQETRV